MNTATITLVELVLVLIPTLILVLILAILAIRRPDTAEIKRLADRTRELETDHIADQARIQRLSEEIYYLGRIIVMLGDTLASWRETLEKESAIYEPIPDEAVDFLKKQHIQPWVIDDVLGVQTDYTYLLLLQQKIATHFTIEELYDIYFELGLKPDDIKGHTIKDKARNLLLHVDQRGQLERFITILQRYRSNVNWLNSK